MFDFTRDSLKINVLIGYVLAFFAVFFASYIVVKSYNNLEISMAKISSPNTQLIKINSIVTSLSEAENNFQLFSLSRNTMYLRRYISKVSVVKEELQNININEYENPKSKVLIDSMCSLLDLRKRDLGRYLYFLRNNINEYSVSLQHQLDNIADSSRTKVIVNTTIDLSFDTLETIIPKKKKSFLSRLFTKKNKLLPDTIRTIIARRENIIDSTFILQPDTLLRKVDSLLVLSRKKDLANKKLIDYKTYRLIRTNIRIITKLKLLVEELENEYLINVQKETLKARNLAERSILIISLVLGIGFLVSMIFMLIIFRDISKSNFYKQKLIKAKREAENLAKVKEDFLANMSHEIRTPLNSIIGFTNILKNSSLEKSQHKNVEIIESSSKHLLCIVNDILNLSKLESKETNLKKEVFKPYNIAYEVYKLLHVEAQLRGINLLFTFSGDKKMSYFSDAFRIKQIVINILNNAIKFSPQGEVQLIVSLIDEPETGIFMNIIIKDNGIGIKEDKLKYIFDNFSQAETFTERKYGGTGLGLSISKKLIDLLGGSIDVKSIYGEGSEFTISIPLAKADDEIKVIAEQKIILSDSVLTQKILVAEDDDYSRLLMENIFEKQGLNADFVANGQEAIDLLTKSKYDLIITDINMPIINGLELCKFIRENKNVELAKLPIIGLTANVRRKDVEHYISIGMNNCILKPFNENELIEIISECLTKQNIPLAKVNEDDSNDESDDVDDINIEKEDLSSINSSNILEERMYSISEIQQFIGDDKAILFNLIDTFIASAEENCSHMKNALAENNYYEIGNIAHRMLSSYTQIKVISIVPMLKELDDILHVNKDQRVDQEFIAALVDKIILLSDKLIEQLKSMD